jgi:hypothetical protein
MASTTPSGCLPLPGPLARYTRLPTSRSCCLSFLALQERQPWRATLQWLSASPAGGDVGGALSVADRSEPRRDVDNKSLISIFVSLFSSPNLSVYSKKAVDRPCVFAACNNQERCGRRSTTKSASTRPYGTWHCGRSINMDAPLVSAGVESVLVTVQPPPSCRRRATRSAARRHKPFSGQGWRPWIHVSATRLKIIRAAPDCPSSSRRSASANKSSHVWGAA